MAKIADCKVDVTYAGPFALELRSFVEPGVWTGEKTAVLEAIFEGLKAAGYHYFSSRVPTMRLQRKGQSAVYRVPLAQRGALAPYRGKLVHIVCLGRTHHHDGRRFALAELSQNGQLLRSTQADSK